RYLLLLAGLGGASLADAQSLYDLSAYGVLLALLAAICAGWPQRLAAGLDRRWENRLRPAWLAIVLLLSTAWLVEMSFNPFLYFRF
ncbi:MAG: MBOAT family protein, partial [Clostridiaceae bacterium]|nr:MBOAT family protein [Clostridiaceae bacterium]